MKCPYCGQNNIAGSDECESCHEDLASLDGVVPRTKIERVLMSDPIAKLSPRPALAVDRQTSAFEAVRKMNAAKIGSVLVVSGERVDGILTERDIVHKVLAVGHDLNKTAAETIMTPDPEELSVDDTLAYAVNRMAVGGYRHIPVTKNGRPVGIISIRDVLKYLAKLFP